MICDEDFFFLLLLWSRSVGRLAPFQRGIYEDYVANFWCATAPAAKWKQRFDVPTLARMALAFTVLAAAPAMWHQIRRPSKEGFVWCMAGRSRLKGGIHVVSIRSFICFARLQA